MNQAELAESLAGCDDAERVRLLSTHADSLDVPLARKLKDICLDAWTSDPARTTNAATALALIAARTRASETSALAAWAAGIAALTRGQMKDALQCLNDAEKRFLSLDQPQPAAATQVSKLYALAVLGRYDEALECGLQAREVLLAHGDDSAAGTIELNLGNIYQRRDRYAEAEAFLRAARSRLAPLAAEKKLAQIDNSLANALSFQHKFRAAEELYRHALESAATAGLEVTQAEIESNLSYLALFQGRYDRALDYLERARRRYATLGMTHQTAITEQEMADTYLEINLAPEAAEIYERVTIVFARLEMRAEQARAMAYHGRARLLLGEFTRAAALLAGAHELYEAEENPVGIAIVALAQAQLHFTQGDFASCIDAAREAEMRLAPERAWGRLLAARWLRGEALRLLNRTSEARALFEETLVEAVGRAVPQIALRCHSSLGLIAVGCADFADGEWRFNRAVQIIEDLRAPLPAEEFRMAFVGDKLTPYAELVRLCLAAPDGARLREAFIYVERARSRSLIEMMGGALEFRFHPQDEYEEKLLLKHDELREELNWFYSQLDRPPREDAHARATAFETVSDAVHERESKLLEITRQLRARHGNTSTIGGGAFDLAALQHLLPADTALVEYTNMDFDLMAFVVTRDGVSVCEHLGAEERIAEEIEGLRFQLDTLRFGAGDLHAHKNELTIRTQRHLKTLYESLLAPLEARLKANGITRLVIVPHRALHYVPFHALWDGARYIVERFEVSYSPSATVLAHCLARPPRHARHALLLGCSGANTPHVRDEITQLAALFDESTLLLDDAATCDALRRTATSADILHLACHGQFRPDNPLFSSLELADGWLTVRDVYTLDTNCELVVLSACETGVSAVAPGDELLGLARGFLSAGVPSLVLSLWTVDDETTVTLMSDFYRRLLADDSPAAALRQAQLRMLEREPHPFLWSPFMVVGRW